MLNVLPCAIIDLNVFPHRRRLKEKNGFGSRLTDVNDETVEPTGSPSGVRAVMMVTPLVWRRRTRRKESDNQDRP